MECLDLAHICHELGSEYSGRIGHISTFTIVVLCFAGGIVNNSLRPQIPTWCDPEWKSLMESCWASDPVERPSFSEISKKLRSMAASMNVK